MTAVALAPSLVLIVISWVLALRAVSLSAWPAARPALLGPEREIDSWSQTHSEQFKQARHVNARRLDLAGKAMAAQVAAVELAAAILFEDHARTVGVVILVVTIACTALILMADPLTERLRSRRGTSSRLDWEKVWRVLSVLSRTLSWSAIIGVCATINILANLWVAAVVVIIVAVASTATDRVVARHERRTLKEEVLS